MTSTNRFQTLTWRAAAAALALMAASACAVDKQSAPALAGPSGFGQSLIVTAAPQVLSRDGSSMSTISVTARNADGSPATGRRLLFSASSGTLLTSEVLTSNDGTASVVYVAPTRNTPVSGAVISVTPIEAGDVANTHGTSLIIELLGPDVPVAAFSTTPPSSGAPGATYRALLTFDATATTLGGTSCGSRCTYAWDFGDGSTGKDLVAQHQYNDSGVFNATLTVTTSTGTSNSITKPVVIAPPALTTPEFTFAPCASLVPKCMTLTDSSVPPDGITIEARLWDFGDSTSPVSTTDPVIDHTFPANPNAVTYNVRLRLTDNRGRTSTILKAVAVP
jgi:PKD repeat protein